MEVFRFDTVRLRSVQIFERFVRWSNYQFGKIHPGLKR